MNATYRMMIFGAQPPGALLGGLLATLAGLHAALAISLLAMISPALWIFFSPVYRLTQMPRGPQAPGQDRDGADD
jgi:hypothetical protein